MLQVWELSLKAKCSLIDRYFSKMKLEEFEEELEAFRFSSIRM